MLFSLITAAAYHNLNAAPHWQIPASAQRPVPLRSWVTAVVAGEEMKFLLGSREGAGDTTLDVYSPSSPLGEAISGKQVGDTVEYQAPNGATIKVEISAAEPYKH